MAEYIEKTKLLEQIGKDSAGHEGMYGDEWVFMDTISDMPTIDIVRCSECEHFKGNGGVINATNGGIYRWCAKGHKDGLPNWYCADGERKGAK